MTRSLALSLLVSALALVAADARSITWSTTPVSGDWYTPANWVQGVVPNGPADKAIFGDSSIKDVSFPPLSQTTLSEIQILRTGDSISQIDISGGTSVSVEGAGIIGIPFGQLFELFLSGDPTNGAGTISFHNSSVANIYSVIVGSGNPGGTMFFYDQSSIAVGFYLTIEGTGRVEFHDQSTANVPLFELYPNTADTPPAVLIFAEQSKAVNANFYTVGNNGNTIGPAFYFNDDSTIVGSIFNAYDALATYDLSGHHPPGLTIGELSLGGQIFLGANNLSAQPTGLYPDFVGSLHDGGASAGTGGSFTLLPAAFAQTLSGVSDYTGGTTVEGSVLYASATKSSSTGSGPVQVNGGKLAGHGIVGGAVTVGSGLGQPAMLGAGGPGKATGQTLTIKKKLTFRSDGIYAATVSGSRVLANKIAAKGVTIGAGAQMTVTDSNQGTIPVGTVFTLISNTAKSAIAGTFGNLPEGGTITAGANTYQANYEGGDGNDLTLTVVP